MHLIKVILVVAVIACALLAFRNRNRVGMRAGARIGALLLAAFAIASIIDTGIPQTVADHVGVTRGTDFILYAFVIVFAVTTAGSYLRSRELERRMATIVRVSAIRDSVLAGGLPTGRRVSRAAAPTAAVARSERREQRQLRSTMRVADKDADRPSR